MLQTPRGGAVRGAAAADGRQVSIGTVLNLLRDEFPEVTISKIRFLEAEGLVEPQRTPSGYRKFSTDDVHRLAQVLRIQRDHYLPLKVIKEQLEAAAAGEQPALPSPGAPPEPDHELPTVTRLGRAELLAAAEVSEDQLAAWEAYGLLAPLPGGGYDAETVRLAGLLTELGGYGLEPRHLRGMKAAADREAGLVEQVVAPLRRHRNPQTRARAEATAQELAALSVRLHTVLVDAALKARPR
ncbi:MerR family transcriptional regulator [Streptomyces sp. NPDC060194]|uniref:transcriptional regulator FtsR n=1 Tax=Streptomyces sp. NPDC060194 TaxID=3347069 RepID=UPI00365DD5AD